MKKNMKSVVFVVTCMSLMTGAILVGCAEMNPEMNQEISTGIQQKTNQYTPETNTQEEMENSTDTITSEERPQAPEEYEDNFQVDSEAARAFAQKVKDATENINFGVVDKKLAISGINY